MHSSRIRLNLEACEARDLPAAQPLPVLLVIADQQDFYYKEYNDTRNALLTANVPVTVAATTTNPSTPHAGTGQGTSSGIVIPDIALSNANASNYSAIAFVGGWGASMYQYAFNDPDLNGANNNLYYNSFYNGDSNLNDGVIAPQKVTANTLITNFLSQNKPVAGVCHGVTVLAWARVNGVSPVAGKTICVPLTDGTPGMLFNGTNYANGYTTGQLLMAQYNGANASNISGQVGNPTTTTDDVIVDGRIITAENQNSATHFGTVIAQQVIALANPTVTGTVVNDGAAQRSRVTSLTVTFSSNVSAITLTAPGAVILSRNGVELTSSEFTLTPGTGSSSTFRLTFNNGFSGNVENGSLADGQWTFRLPTFNSTTSFHRLFGDATGNATTDGADLVMFGNEFNSNGTTFDYNTDAIVDGSDLVQLGNRFGMSL